MQQMRWNTISVQLFVWFLLCALALTLSFFFIFYVRSTDQINASLGEAALNNVSQAAENFNLLVKSYDSLTKSVNTNLDIQRLLAHEETELALHRIDELTITNTLGSIFYSSDDIKGIHIITNTGSIYSYESINHPLDSNYENREWYQKLLHSSGEIVWLGTQHTLAVQESAVFSFGRVIYNLYSNKPIGVLLIEADPKRMNATLDNLRLGATSKSYIFSNTNDLLMANGSDVIPPAKLIHIIQSFGDKSTFMANDSGNLWVIYSQPTLQWKVVSITPKKDLSVKFADMKRFIIITVSILILFSVVLATLFSRSISAPIRKLVQEMRRVEKGNFNIDIPIKSYAEINFLVFGFNRMVREINQLVERVRMVTVSEKNAHIYALQSQVNPHFLYNTLDMIYWMLDEKDNEKLGNIILSLSRMFQYSSDWGKSDVTLREELEQTQHYLAIIQARVEDIHIQVDLPEAWLSIQIPKMTLQPLIENAIVHGLLTMGRPRALHIYLEVSEDNLKIHIADNGIGMPMSKLTELQLALRQVSLLETHQMEEKEKDSSLSEPMNNYETERRGIGIINVHRRLVLKYGSPYGLQFTSEEHKGTTVTLLLPSANSMECSP